MDKIEKMKQTIVFFVLALMGCQPSQQQDASFINDIESTKKPWTSEVFEETEDDFTFAIISDLTGGERPGIFSVAVEQLNRFDPTFVLSVGDLIEGGTKDVAQLENEWDSFDQRAAKFNMPFFHLGGNHDLSNAVMQDFWKKRFGALYYFFVYDNVLFLMLDSEDFDDVTMKKVDEYRADAMKIIYGEIEGDFDTTRYFHLPERRTGALTTTQQQYFIDVLNKYKDVKWTFIFMHKPLWTREDDHGFAPLEKALVDRNYTVINGHEHSFSYRKRLDQEYMMLGTTGGFQNPEDEHAFDHVTLVHMAAGGPVITHLRMDGILDQTGHIPLGGDTLNFQASKK